ncbi:MAG TPA: adenosine deaminase [Bacteroidota bacterium]|nr:adenosine deaminase [Bacteroidota bacterium]
MKISEKVLRAAPKVLLHDHLDGGLRPSTIVELARDRKYRKLPTEDATQLATWFHRGAQRGSLPLYLEGFAHTTAVMQSVESLERVAYEMMEDMYNDGVVYIETRFAPVFHTDGGLHWDEAVNAVLLGLERGRKDFGVEFGLIICAMRNMSLSQEMAELAVDFRERGVVGFDLAGEEGGFPPKKHVDAFHYIQRENFNITIHAGEAFGKESIWQAIQWCGAHRIGHATRLIEDIGLDPHEPGRIVKMGYLAQYILDKRIPLEICLTSNVDTGAVKSIEEHPFGLYYRYRFRVTLNTDDRLMSATTMTNEFKIAHRSFGLSLDDLEKVTINSMKSAFIPYNRRIKIIYDVIKPGYAKVRASRRRVEKGEPVRR